MAAGGGISLVLLLALLPAANAYPSSWVMRNGRSDCTAQPTAGQNVQHHGTTSTSR